MRIAVIKSKPWKRRWDEDKIGKLLAHKALFFMKTYEYNNNNVFSKILKGEVPVRKVYENPHCLAFHDHVPKASIHILIIPKGSYITFDHFQEKASLEEIIGFYKGIFDVIHQEKIPHYKLISHNGVYSGQEVPHYHVHIMSGTKKT